MVKEVNEVSVIESQMLPVFNAPIELEMVGNEYHLKNYDTLVDSLKQFNKQVDNYTYNDNDRQPIKKIKSAANKTIKAFKQEVKKQQEALFSPVTSEAKEIETLIDYTKKLASGLKVKGLINIQYVVSKGEIYVLEVNPRASRTVPFLSKVTGVPVANIAMQCILGKKLRDLGITKDIADVGNFVSVKVPVFSFQKLKNVDTTLGPEMKSTGEVIGTDINLEKALYKGLTAAGVKIKDYGRVLFTIDDKNKEAALNLAKGFSDVGFSIVATEGTGAYFEGHGLKVKKVGKIDNSDYSVLDAIQNGDVDIVINTTTKGKSSEKDGFKIRRKATEHGVICFTSLDTANALLRVIESMSFRVQSL